MKFRIWSMSLIAAVLILTAGCAGTERRDSETQLGEMLVGSGRSSLIIKPSATSECVTFTERYKRHLLYLYDEEQQSYYLITQNFEFGAGCFEGYDPTVVTVTANKLDVKSGQVSKETVWSFTTKGIRGERTGYPLTGLYAVADLGPRGEITKYFSLISGAFIGSSSLQPLTIETPDMSKVRLITAHENKICDYVGGDIRIATIFYADNKNLKQALAITLSKPPSEICILRSLRFADSEDAGRLRTLSDETTFGGFSITMELACENGGVSVEIPVVGDMLFPDKATVTGSSEIRIIDISPEKPL